MKEFTHRILLLFILTSSLIVVINIPSASAEYTFVELSDLAANLDWYLGMDINTTGVARQDIFHIPEILGEAFLATYVSSYTGVWLLGGRCLQIPHGSTVKVSGVPMYDYFFQCYYFEVHYWGPVIEWNPADVNFDLKVDINDAIIFCGAYGTTPSDYDWYSHCDIAEPYDMINLYDVLLMVQSYGDTFP